MSTISFNPLIQLKLRPKLGAKTSKSSSISARLDNSQDEQLNLSVLRFTLGIPGLDESYLPRWIGYGFGSLIVVNHFLSSNSTPAQLTSEALGLCLAGFSVSLPYLGKFLKGATNSTDQMILPEEASQVFVMSEDVSDTQKEDLAWATYILLRNTKTTAVLVWISGQLCARGYWNIPDDVSKDQLLGWFEKQVEKLGLSEFKDTVYFPQSSDSELWEMLPKGTRSVLVQPVLSLPSSSTSDQMDQIEGFVLLTSTTGYAYSDRDRSWIRAVANKFRGKFIPMYKLLFLLIVILIDIDFSMTSPLMARLHYLWRRPDIEMNAIAKDYNIGF
ncbi:protein COFACTOR ASSEMBLY OF COMPLEX C SUBUNIT B CCB2, chloroplastic-like [Rutidosis leptorrhynchoides]|uniref:protein COFACTOR ASSEMBLY OF COMPLEX C SUBUNIT B CCB2, chloroplastic-like n=1 Tax=Rutidosis leptorrhynchoides TaxID=125765 RepID=UPI003A9A5B02